MAVDMFLKLDGIAGESTDSVHKDEIEIFSFSWGVSNPTTVGGTGGSGAGKASFHDISVTKLFDKASPQLMIHSASGKVIPSALLSVRSASQDPSGKGSSDFLKIILSDVLVSGLESAGAREGDRPTDEVTLAFQKIEISYQPPGADLVDVSWDIARNQGG
jgi:type VI secretion system secreted protein Hcp